MSKKIRILDTDVLSHLLELSNLLPDSIDVQSLQTDLDMLNQHIDVLSEFDKDTNSIQIDFSKDVEQLREDNIELGLQISELKKITPEFVDGYFSVPKVVGEGV